MHLCHTSADTKATLRHTERAPSVRPTAARPRCCRLCHCFLLPWGCSPRAPRTKVSMWITSTARCGVCLFDLHLLFVFLQARALGFLIPLSLELFTLRCLSCSLLSLVNPKHSDVEIQRSSWQGPWRICGWWQSRGPCWMMKKVLFSFFL